jgi:hypothetical protein
VSLEGNAPVGRRGVKLRDKLVQGLQGCDRIIAGSGLGNSQHLGLQLLGGIVLEVGGCGAAAGQGDGNQTRRQNSSPAAD